MVCRWTGPRQSAVIIGFRQSRLLRRFSLFEKFRYPRARQGSITLQQAQPSRCWRWIAMELGGLLPLQVMLHRTGWARLWTGARIALKRKAPAQKLWKLATFTQNSSPESSNGQCAASSTGRQRRRQYKKTVSDGGSIKKPVACSTVLKTISWG